jgi:aminomethyltransferase
MQISDTMHVSNTDFIGTPFNTRTAPLNDTNGKWMAWDVYHVVEAFSNTRDDLATVREAAAVIDMSPLAKYDITGLDAERYVNHLVPRDAKRMDVGHVYWAPWCDHHGKVVSDGMIFRLSDSHFRITGDPCSNWLQHTRHEFDVEIADITHERGILSLQGPKSQQVLEAATGEDWSDLKFSRVRMAEIGGRQVEVARQGFTGEHGYELCVAKADAVPVWDAVFESGRAFGLGPCGLAAADVARVEAGLIIPGPDYTKGGPPDERGSSVKVFDEYSVSPFECRMGKMVNFEKDCDFFGREALLREQETGSTYNMVGLTMGWEGIVDLFTRQNLPPNVVPGPMWIPCPVLAGGNKIGRATSNVYSPAAQSIVAFGFLEREYCVAGEEVSVEFQVGGLTGLVGARIVELPFINLSRAS